MRRLLLLLTYRVVWPPWLRQETVILVIAAALAETATLSKIVTLEKAVKLKTLATLEVLVTSVKLATAVEAIPWIPVGTLPEATGQGMNVI